MTTDQQRLEHLVSQGFLNRVLTPRIQGERFEWVIEDQVWIYTGLIRAQNIATPIIFSETNIPRTKRSSGALVFSETNGGWVGTFGLVYFDNARDVYVITVDAQLSPGSGGGYGILIEAALNEVNAEQQTFTETGYILQFDRGLRNIVIKERVEGKEVSFNANL